MNERRPDFERLQRFSREGEQSAFAEVVGRHLDLALHSDGTRWAWGDNEYGQLGNGKFRVNNMVEMNAPRHTGHP